MMSAAAKAAAEKARVPHFDLVPAPNTSPNAWPQSTIDDGADDDTVTDDVILKSAPLEQVQAPPPVVEAPKAKEGEKKEGEGDKKEEAKAE